MKKLVMAAMAMSILLAVLAFAQSSMQQDTMKQDTTKSDTSGKMGKAVPLAGTIGSDGKTFTSDKNNKEWTIVNPDAVKGHEGHHVKLTAHVNKDNNEIHVMSLKMMGEKGKSSEGSMKKDEMKH